MICIGVGRVNRDRVSTSPPNAAVSSRRRAKASQRAAPLRSWTALMRAASCVISALSGCLFAYCSGLVEIHVTLAISGEDFRGQLDGVGRQARGNAPAVEVGGELHLQAASL